MTATVGQPCPHRHRQCPEQVGQGDHQAHQAAIDAQAFDDLWQPHAYANRADDAAKVDGRQGEHLGVGQSCAQRIAMRCTDGLLFLGQALVKPGFLSRVEPFCLGRGIDQHEEASDAKQYGRHRLGDQQQLPVLQAQDAVLFHQPAGQGRADDVGRRNAQQEGGSGFRPPFAGEPVGEVQVYAGREARFGKPKQKARNAETDWPGGERGGHGDQPPGDHDSRNPHPCAEALH